MDEDIRPASQETNTSTTSSKKTLPLLALILVIVLAVGIAYLIIRQFSDFGEYDPAKYLPKDVAYAAIIDFSSTPEKRAAMDTIRNMLKSAGIEKPEQELFKSLKDELGIDAEKEVLPRLNGKGGLAVLTEMRSMMMPGMVFVIGTRGPGDADALMTLIGNALNKHRKKFERLQSNGLHYYMIDDGDGPVYVGALKSSIVITFNEDDFKKMIGVSEGEPSLLQDENFVKLRTRGRGNFASIYYNGEGYYKLIGPMISMMSAQAGADYTSSMKELIESGVAFIGNASANEDGIVIDMKGLMKKPFKVDSVSLDELASTIPKDACFALNAVGWNKSWQMAKDILLKNRQMKDSINQWTSSLKMAFGFDPFGDILDRITTFGIYYSPKVSADKKDFSGILGVVLGLDKPDVVKKAVDSFSSKAILFGVKGVKRVNIEGSNGMLWQLNDGNISNVFVNDKALACFSMNDSKAAVQNAFDTTVGRSDSLASTESFKSIKKNLSDKASAFLYFDIKPILDATIPDMDKDAQRKAKAITKTIGELGMTCEYNGNEFVGKAYLPFKKNIR